MYKVSWDSESIEDLEKISVTDAIKIVEKVESYLIQDPKSLGKQLSSQYKGLYRYRYRNYRIIYQLFEEELIILVVKVGHSSSVYNND